MLKHISMAAIAALLLLPNLNPANAARAKTKKGVSAQFSAYVDGKGRIRLPPDFRQKLVHLGSWFVPEGDAAGFHEVYTEASAIEAYRNTGAWPDGATIVKEVRIAQSGDYTTSKGVKYATNTNTQWFVMIKDATGRFANDPNWGDGWGWALFKPNNPNQNLSLSYGTDCLGCHTPARQNDLIYVEGYPILSGRNTCK